MTQMTACSIMADPLPPPLALLRRTAAAAASMSPTGSASMLFLQLRRLHFSYFSSVRY